MISYVLVDYAYFALAMSFDKRKARDARFKEAKDLPPTFDKTVLNANGNLGKGGHTYGKSVEELKGNSTNSVPSVTFYFLNNPLSDISRKSGFPQSWKVRESHGKICGHGKSWKSHGK